MNINGTDANGNAFAKVQEIQVATRDAKSVPQVDSLDNRNISQMTTLEKNELPVSEKVVIDAIERANKALSGPNMKFEFSIHKDTKAIVIKVVDADTNKVIREIPPENILDMVARMCDMAGLFVDERR